MSVCVCLCVLFVLDLLRRQAGWLGEPALFFPPPELLLLLCAGGPPVEAKGAQCGAVAHKLVAHGAQIVWKIKSPAIHHLAIGRQAGRHHLHVSRVGPTRLGVPFRAPTKRVCVQVCVRLSVASPHEPHTCLHHGALVSNFPPQFHPPDSLCSLYSALLAHQSHCAVLSHTHTSNTTWGPHSCKPATHAATRLGNDYRLSSSNNKPDRSPKAGLGLGDSASLATWLAGDLAGWRLGKLDLAS